MTADLKLVREILDSRLKEAASGRALSDSILIQQVADPMDMTQEAGERDVAVQMLDRESTVARRLRSAIDRVEDGTYGLCTQCEEEIAPKRLKAIPWAELCIDCQERADELASQRRGILTFKDITEAA